MDAHVDQTGDSDGLEHAKKNLENRGEGYCRVVQVVLEWSLLVVLIPRSLPSRMHGASAMPRKSKQVDGIYDRFESVMSACYGVVRFLSSETSREVLREANRVEALVLVSLAYHDHGRAEQAVLSFARYLARFQQEFRRGHTQTQETRQEHQACA